MPYQRCPVCEGTGVNARPPGIPATQQSWVAAHTGPYTCHVCSGAGILLYTNENSNDLIPDIGWEGDR
jgi:hypothetical protein